MDAMYRTRKLNILTLSLLAWTRRLIYPSSHSIHSRFFLAVNLSYLTMASGGLPRRITKVWVVAYLNRNRLYRYYPMFASHTHFIFLYGSPVAPCFIIVKRRLTSFTPQKRTIQIWLWYDTFCRESLTTCFISQFIPPCFVCGYCARLPLSWK